MVVVPAGVAGAQDPGTADWVPVPRDRVAAECGMDPKMLEDATVRLTDTPFVVIRHGKLCWEGGYPGGTTTTYHIASVTKTVGALLTGMVDHRSTLSDEDVVTRWMPPEDLGAINPEARIAHVLSMASTNKDLRYGHRQKWTYDTLGDREINRLVGVMNKAIAGQPQQFPGATNAKEFAQKELFDALGMRASNWPGEAIGGTMNSTVRDMARMGIVLLQRGRYNGRQLLDEEYVYKMTHPAFEDANTGYGYLTYANADKNWVYSTGTNDTACSPYTRWASYPHRPFFEAPDPNGGFPGEQKHDVGLVWAAGAGGQRIVVHRALNMVIAVRDDAVDVSGSGQVGTFEGHKTIWNAIRPALVALDPVYRGDEAAFCKAYQRSEYAPSLREGWFPTAAQGSDSAPAATPRSCSSTTTFDAFSARASRGGGLSVRVTRRSRRTFTFSLLQEATGASVLTRARRVARHVSTSDAFTVRRRLPDGYYVAEVRQGSDVRRIALERRGGRFRARPDASIRRACGAIDSFTARPAFGGRSARPLEVAYRLRRSAERVTVEVLGRRARAAKGPTSTGQLHTLRLSARGLPRRRDVRVQITVRSGGETTTETVTARRL
jgi:CubicO group peptidase (beta-lactamase class C family)